MIRQYNKRFALKWDNIRNFLAVHYKFNTGIDTPFWRACREQCDLAGAAEVVEYYRENGPGIYHQHTLLNRLSRFGLEGYWALLVGQKIPRMCPASRSAKRGAKSKSRLRAKH